MNQINLKQSNSNILKVITIISTLIFLFSCSNENKQKIINNEKQVKNIDTIVNRKVLTVEPSDSYPIQTVKDIEYSVSVKDKVSNLKYEFTAGNDGKVVIRRNFDFLNLPPQKSIFDFDELNYVLKEAKNDFKINSLNYLIYGTLDSAKDINSVLNITKKYIDYKKGKLNISTKDYGKISELILQSDIVYEINKTLSAYSKVVTKINIEKAFFIKPNRNSNEMITCFVVMIIENKSSR